MKLKNLLSADSWRRRLVNLGRRLRGRRLTVVVATAHKVGSTWVANCIRDAGDFEDNPGLVPEGDRDGTGLLLLSPRSLAALSSLRAFHIFKSHSHPLPGEEMGKEGNVKVVTVVRDPRDVLVSALHYLANLPEREGGWGEAFRRLSQGEKLREVISRGDFILDRLESWSRARPVCTVRYESFLGNPAGELERIFNFLGLEADRSRIAAAVEKNSFRVMSGRSRGVGDSSSFYRKGIAGDWKNVFDGESVTLFKTVKEGRWNTLLVDLGYEADGDWLP